MNPCVIEYSSLESRIKELAAKYHAEAAYLFGSYARGEARADSDLDVLIDGGENFYPADVFSIAEELHRTFGKPVDVYEVSEINEGTPFYRSVMQDRLRVA